MTGRFYLSGNQTVRYQNKSLAYTTRGVHPDHQHLENTQITSGRYLNPLDLQGRRKVCIIGNIIEREIFGQQSALGKTLQIGDAVYTVVGTYFDTGGENEMRIIYLPITTAQIMNNSSQRLHQIMFTTGDLTINQVDELEAKIRLGMAQRHQFDVQDRSAIWMFNLAEEFAQFQSLIAAIRAFVWFVGIGSIIAGIIGVSNIMLIVIKDRTQEIGVRKALGATPRSIISMVLTESIFITTLAGYVGLAAGVVLLALAGSVEVEYFRNPRIDIRIGMIATLVLVAAGTLAGWMPARKAALIHPVEAMKD
jgi:putative ABC transport system permease protein